MLKITIKIIVVIVAFSFFAQKSFCQTPKEPTTPKEWSAPFAPFRIIGNVYYVGTYDLACYLIVTPKGNILICQTS